MTALLMPKVFPSDTVKSTKMEPTDSDSTCVIGVFSHHRDAKVALQELKEAGFPSKWITLFARDFQRYSWSSSLRIHNCFNETAFNFDRSYRHFFRRMFQRGKYLVLVTGNGNDVNSAGTIMGRRRSHSKVWHFR